MKTFENIKFNGTFRDYQQNVLNNFNVHLDNKKIHIVAAPGSGKTVLGLELIRRLNSPALIFSPSVTIRQQWGERFEEKFLPDSEKAEDYFSYDLKNPKLITSVTYQALHAAFNKLSEPVDDEAEPDESIDPVRHVEDFSQFDLLTTINKAGIKTICLDEAHHLRSEWQKALESFISVFQSEITINALTATPPYDSTFSEWNRYISLCGEIDEEISVPQLVAQGTLCPHQDYVYFNYPTEAETRALSAYKEKSLKCVGEIVNGVLLDEILQSSGLFLTYMQKEELILENAKGFIAILCLAHTKGVDIPKGLIKLLSPSEKLPAFHLSFAEAAFEFVINNPEIFGEGATDKLRYTLLQNGLIERKKVRLASNDELNRSLISSIGKLNSITKIVEAEAAGLGQSLRMLILTDYIKKDLLRLVGTEEPINAMGTVPIFEMVRRNIQTRYHVAVLSGNLVIVPNAILTPIKHMASSKDIVCASRPMGFTDYSEISFAGSNKNKVAVMTEAFQQGLINILIGTKSLLGEGWDSPCINSLILASFVGTFMLSNQMRGRAIRIDSCDPAKVSNIWHLVTVEPPLAITGDSVQKLFAPSVADKNKLISEDYDMLVHRFECFLAPSYDGKVIESGIDRIGFIKPPYDQKGIFEINRKMLEQSADRASLQDKWKGAVKGSLHPEINEVNKIPNKVLPKGFLFVNALHELFLGTMLAIIIRVLLDSMRSAHVSPEFILGVLLAAFIGYFTITGMVKIFRYISPKRTIETLGGCVLKSLIEIGEIQSPKARLSVNSYSEDTYIYSSLSDATMHEKNIFAKAIGELLTSIDNPRYLLIKWQRLLFFTWKDYNQSFACPSVLSVKKESVEIFAKHLAKTAGKYELQYTRSETGRAELLKCRKRSYINRNEIYIKSNKVAKSQWE